MFALHQIEFFVMLFVFMFSILFWKLSFKTAIIFVIFEGVFRKWIFPQSSDLIYFIKDMMLLGSYFGCVLVDRFKFHVFKYNYLLLLLVLYSVWVCIEMLNPNLPNLMVGLLGCKMHLLYLPMIVMVKEVFQTPEMILKYVKYIFYLSIPVIILAYFQFYSSINSILNIYAGGIGATAGMPLGYTRVVGTFPYLTGFSTFLLLIVIIGIGLLLQNNFRIKENWSIIIVLILALIAVPMTGSRTLLISLMIDFFIGLYILYKRHFLNKRLFIFVMLFSVILGFTLSLGSFKALDSFMARTNNVDDILSRISTIYIDPLNSFDNAGLFGYGTGSAYQGALKVVSENEYSSLPSFTENEDGRVMIELGIFGFMIFMLCKLITCKLSYLSSILAKRPAEFGLGIISVMFIIPHLFCNSLYNVTASIYYWFLLGVALMIIHSVRSSNYIALLTRETKVLYR
jgi:hypothetical protein